MGIVTRLPSVLNVRKAVKNNDCTPIGVKFTDIAAVQPRQCLNPG